MSAALRPDDAPDEAAGCAHPPDAIHWHPLMPRGGSHGTPDHLVQRGVCRTCRRQRKRRGVIVWGPDEDVDGADPVPRHRHDGPGVRRYG